MLPLVNFKANFFKTVSCRFEKNKKMRSKQYLARMFKEKNHLLDAFCVVPFEGLTLVPSSRPVVFLAIYFRTSSPQNEVCSQVLDDGFERVVGGVRSRSSCHYFVGLVSAAGMLTECILKSFWSEIINPKHLCLLRV